MKGVCARLFRWSAKLVWRMADRADMNARNYARSAFLLEGVARDFEENQR